MNMGLNDPLPRQKFYLNTICKWACLAARSVSLLATCGPTDNSASVIVVMAGKVGRTEGSNGCCIRMTALVSKIPCPLLAKDPVLSIGTSWSVTDAGIPVQAHSCLVRSLSIWTGGLKAIGRTIAAQIPRISDSSSDEPYERCATA